MKDVDDMLSDCQSKTKSTIIKNKELAGAIAYFLEKVRTGETEITLHWFYTHKLQPKFGGPVSMNSVYRYVRNVLRIDPSTGQPL